MAISEQMLSSWMVHAEANAIFNAARVGISLNGATIYVTKFPCIMCANAIIQVGIKRLYTLDLDPLDCLAELPGSRLPLGSTSATSRSGGTPGSAKRPGPSR